MKTKMEMITRSITKGLLLISLASMFSCKAAITAYNDYRNSIDNTPPAISSVSAVSTTSIEVTFSEALASSSAENIENYFIQGSPAINITDAVLSGNNLVILTVSTGMVTGRNYRLSVVDIDDKSGNTLKSQSIDFSGRGIVVAHLENTPPSLTNSSDISIDVQVDGDGDGVVDGTDLGFYKYRLDSGVWSDELSETTDIVDTEITTVGNDETHTISVLARNSEGRWQDEPTTFTWRIDRKPPESDELVLTGLPESVTAQNSAEITVGGAEIAAYKYRLAADEWSDEIPATTPITLADLEGDPPADYSIQVIGRDAAGNWQPESEPYAYSWEVNLSDPIAELNDEPDTYTSNDGINIQVGGVGITHYQYRIDGGSWSTWTAVSQKIQADGLSESVHTLEVLGRNTVGREQDTASPTNLTWTVDMTPPSRENIVLSNLPDDPTNSQTANIMVSGDDVFWYRYRLDYTLNGETIEGVWTGRYSASDDINLSSSVLDRDGTYTLYVVGVDRALNETPYTEPLVATTQWYSWKIDTSEPEAELSGLPDSPTSDRTTDITVGGTNVVAYKYRLDGGSWSAQTPVASHIQLSGLDNGQHAIDVIALNNAGTWQNDASPESASWEIDITAPVCELGGLPADGLFNFAHITVESDTAAGDSVTSYKYRYRIQGGSWIGGDSEGWSAERSLSERIDLSNLTADETYELEVAGKDDCGNWQGDSSVAYPSSATTHTWTVGLAGFPVAELFDEPSDPTGDDTLNVRVAGTGVTQYKYSIDGGSWNGDFDIADRITDTLSEGTHTLSVIAYDGANWQPESIATTLEWSIDLTPPAAVSMAMTSPAPAVADGGTTASDDFTFSVSGTDVSHYSYRYYNGSAWTAWSSEAAIATGLSLSNLPGNPETEYTLQVKGRDAQGNWMDDGDCEVFTWTIDKEPPAIPPVNDDSEQYDTDLYLDFYWTDDPSDIAGTTVQVATEDSFSLASIVYEGDPTESGHHRYQVSTSDGSQYYARIKVRDSLGNESGWGEESDGIDVVGSITGRVVNGLSTSTGIVDATVTLVDVNDPDDPDDDTDIASSESETSGYFYFTENVPIGANRYKLRVEKTGYHPAGMANISVTVGATTDCGSIYLIETAATSSDVSGTIIDANFGESVDNATVELLDSYGSVVSGFTQSTESNGTFEMESVDPGTHSIRISKSGFYTLTVSNVVVDGRDGNESIGRQAICQNLAPYQIRVTVQWGQNPQDLDLHVTGPSAHAVQEESGNDGSTNNRFHVFYRNQKSFNETVTSGYYGSAGDPYGTSSTTSLVQDTTSGYGPEAINIFKNIGNYAGGLYKFSVHDYSHSNWYASTIVMRVYNEYGLVREISFPSGAGSNYLWKAMRITVASANNVIDVDDIAVVNSFSSINKSFPAYDNRDKTVFDW